jgi:chaperonin GroEL
MKAITYLDSPGFRKDVLSGIQSLSNLVQVTLGPGGRAILLDQENGPVLATKDGVTVAKHFAAHGPVQRMVAQAAVEASERTVRSVGDGTTTSLVLASAIVEAGQEYLQRNPGASPQQLARDLKDAFNDEIVPLIDSLSKPIRDLPLDEAEKAIWHVAMVSANFDKSIANAVTEAVNLVGQDGMVFVEEGAGGLETTVKHTKGFPFSTGLSDLGGSASTSFVNRKAFGDCVLNGAYVALYDGEINDIETVTPLLRAVASEMDEHGRPAPRPLVLIAHGFGDVVLKVFAQNFRQQTLTIVPVTTPRNGQANGRQGFLFDMLAYTAGNVFDPQGNPLANAMPSTVGFVEEARIGVSESVFITEPEEGDVRSRIEELRAQMDGASEFDCDKLRYRIGRLTGGVATVFAGGSTALEAKERRDRVVDAVSSVRTALESGVVPGGGTTLLHISRKLSKERPENQIFAQALARPFSQILMNAGIASNNEEALYIGNQVGEIKTEDIGTFLVYDALKREPVEFWSSGIFDPTKVTKNALQNALSVAQLLMTCGGAIARQASEGEEQVMAMQRMAQTIQGE